MSRPFQPLDDTWEGRDLPVLREAVRGADAEPNVGIRFEAISAATGLSVDDVYRAARALEDAGFVTVHGVIPPHASRINHVSAEARQITGAWPTPEHALDRMVAALEAIAGNTEADEDTRSRARRALDGIKAGGRDVLVASLAAAAASAVPH
jgi:hypothetical protein